MATTTMAAARLWRSYQKSFAFVASTRSVNDALEKGCSRQTSFCISEEQTVQEAARRFISEGVGSLIATNKKGRVSGVISERDILRKVGLLDKDASKVLVKDIFTPPPHLILARPSNSVEECMQRFDEHDVYRLPILDDGADIVGMVSIEDCLRAVLEDNATVDRLAGKDSEPVFGRRSDMIYMSSVEGCLRAVFEEEAAGQRISSGDAEPMAHCV